MGGDISFIQNAPAIQSAGLYFSQNKAAFSALETAAFNNSPDNMVSIYDVDTLLQKLCDSLGQAATDYAQYQQQVNRQVAYSIEPGWVQTILSLCAVRARYPLLDVATCNAPPDNQVWQQDLGSYYSNSQDGGFLTSAGLDYINMGNNFQRLCIAGNEPSTTPLQGFSTANLDAFIVNETTTDVFAELDQLIIQQMASGANISNYNYQNTFDSTGHFVSSLQGQGANKLAILQQLHGLSSRIQEAEQWESNTLQIWLTYSTDPNNYRVVQEAVDLVQGRIHTASQDSDLSGYMNQNYQTTMQTVLKKNPAMLDSIQYSYRLRFLTGQLFVQGMAGDSANNPVVTSDSLARMANLYGKYIAALGVDYVQANPLNLKGLNLPATGPSITTTWDNLLVQYAQQLTTRDSCQGLYSLRKNLENLSNTPTMLVVKGCLEAYHAQYYACSLFLTGQDKINFTKDISKAYNTTLMEFFGDNPSFTRGWNYLLLNSGTLTLSPCNVDQDPTVESIAQAIMVADQQGFGPEPIPFAPNTLGYQTYIYDVAKSVKSLGADVVRNNLKMIDKWSKLSSLLSGNLTGPMSDDLKQLSESPYFGLTTYRSGYLHWVSASLYAVAFTGKALNGGTKPTDVLSDVGQGIGFSGGFVEGFGKWLAAPPLKPIAAATAEQFQAYQDAKNAFDASKKLYVTRWKNIENFGKGMGSFANFMSAGLVFYQAYQDQGNPLFCGLDVAQGLCSTFQAVTQILEIANEFAIFDGVRPMASWYLTGLDLAGLDSEMGSAFFVANLSDVGFGLGIAGGVISVITIVVEIIYEDVFGPQQKAQDALDKWATLVNNGDSQGQTGFTRWYGYSINPMAQSVNSP